MGFCIRIQVGFCNGLGFKISPVKSGSKKMFGVFLKINIILGDPVVPFKSIGRKWGAQKQYEDGYE
jgi:hypothetical protein